VTATTFVPRAIDADIVGRISAIGASCRGQFPRWPLFQMLGSKEVAAIALGQAGLATLFGIYGGAYPAALVEMFAPTIRCSAASLSLNLGMACWAAPRRWWRST
jgi:hypothetical protein